MLQVGLNEDIIRLVGLNLPYCDLGRSIKVGLYSRTYLCLRFHGKNILRMFKYPESRFPNSAYCVVHWHQLECHSQILASTSDTVRTVVQIALFCRQFVTCLGYSPFTDASARN